MRLGVIRVKKDNLKARSHPGIKHPAWVSPSLNKDTLTCMAAEMECDKLF